MKTKLLLSLMFALACATGFAGTFDWATARELNQLLNAVRATPADAALLQRAADFTAAAPSVAKTDGEKRMIIALNGLIRFQTPGADLSWEAQKKFVDEQLAATTFEKATSVPQYLSLLYIWWYRGWDKEVYAFMKTQPGFEAWGNAGHVAAHLEKWSEAYEYYVTSQIFPDRAVNIAAIRLGDPAKAFAAAKLILGKNYSAKVVSAVISRVVSDLVGNSAVSADEMKAFLLNANRKYSPRLIDDQEAWKPVITTIRTMLETY